MDPGIAARSGSSSDFRRTRRSSARCRRSPSARARSSSAISPKPRSSPGSSTISTSCRRWAMSCPTTGPSCEREARGDGRRRAAARARVERRYARSAAFCEAVAISLDAVIDYAESAMPRWRREAVAAGSPDGRSTGRVALERGRGLPRCCAAQPSHRPSTRHCRPSTSSIARCTGRSRSCLSGGSTSCSMPYYSRAIVRRGSADPRAAAQELIDCFWIKLDERVILELPRTPKTASPPRDGVLTGYWRLVQFRPGRAAQPVDAADHDRRRCCPNESPSAQDACNDVTRLCLDAARRLPLNSPTLDLRVHTDTPDDVIELAAAALLSGGAHPVLLNDDIIVPGARRATAGAPIALRAARDYACDGCFETMVAGQSEFSFGFVSALGRHREDAESRCRAERAPGRVNLRGIKDSWRTQARRTRSRISTRIPARSLRAHLMLACHRYLQEPRSHLLRQQGRHLPLAFALRADHGLRREQAATSPRAAPNYHIFSPLLIGVSTAADSLHVIEKLVFRDNARSP